MVCGDAVLIRLTKNKTAIVDLADEDLAQLNWTALKGTKTWYAYRRVGRGSATELLHREVAKRVGLDVKGKHIDHKDRNGLNCRRSNIRLASLAQNKQNQGLTSSNTSGIKGVSWYKNAWVAEISHNGRKTYLGRFKTSEEAAAAYARAAENYHGEFACAEVAAP